MAELLDDLLRFLVSLKDGLLYFLPGVGRPDRVLTFLAGHLLVTLVTMCLSTLIGVLVGILITRVRFLYKPVIAVAGMLYTIPSLALFGIMVPIVGIGFKPAVIALTLYSLLVIIRNTAVGLDGVSASILEAAQGLGMTRLQILARIELPLALPVVIAGIRIATVAAISMATVASYFGTSSLGTLIFEGIATGGSRFDKVAAGAIGASALAIIFEQMIRRVERAALVRTS
jgi:osmoprotectant transport system permease protein